MGIIDKFFGIQELDDHEKSNKDKLDTHLKNAKEILNSENPETIQKYIHAIITEMNIDLALGSLEKISQRGKTFYNEIPNNFYKICKNIESLLEPNGNLCKYIYFDVDIQNMEAHKLSYGDKVEFAINSPNFKINSIPVLVASWNSSRIIENIININVNNILHPIDNIKNTYIYPLGFMAATNGNHSQFSAILQDEGTSYVERIFDISKLYKYLKFDGDSYRIDTDSENQRLFPNWEEYVFSHEHESSKDEFYIGVLYEIGRLLLKKKPSVYPDNIYKQHANCSWIPDPNAS